MREKLIEVIEDRLIVLYTELLDGGHPSPAVRFRLEGLLEAAQIQQLISVEQGVRLIEKAVEKVFQQSIDLVFGQDWKESYVFPALPVLGRRAPVFKGVEAN